MSLLCLSFSGPAHAGAWNLAPGDGQIISTFDYSTASSAFTDLDTDAAPLTFVKNEGRIFYEHGLSKHLNFVGNGAYQTVQLSGVQNQINFSDFADIELGLRYQIMRKAGLALSVQGSYIIGGGPPNSIFDLNGPQDSFELRGLWGQSKVFEKFSLFFDTQAALRSQNSSDIDEWQTDLTLGYKRDEKYMILGQAFYAKRQGIAQDRFTVPEQQSLKFKLSAVYQYKKNRHVQIGYQDTVAGRNIIRERGVSVGTWIKY